MGYARNTASQFKRLKLSSPSGAERESNATCQQPLGTLPSLVSLSLSRSLVSLSLVAMMLP